MPKGLGDTVETDSVISKSQSMFRSKIMSTVEQEITEEADLGDMGRGEKITINDKTFAVRGSEERKKELLEVRAIAERESGQKQWRKQGICALLLACVIIINVLEPTSSEASVIGIQMCGWGYWLLELAFLGVCGVMTWYAIGLSASEQKLKIKYGINYQEGDVLLEGKALIVLVSIGFVGGLVAGALGLGGGSIYNPALLSLGVHPKVSGATGMFLVLFSTVNTCLINFLNGFLDI